MTTFTGNNTFSKPFSYKPEDDPLFQDADTKALMSGAAQASLSRLAAPGGVWNQDEFDKITKHYMKPIEQQTKQRSESLQAFFRSRGWSDSGSAPEKNLKLFADAERQAAENVYVPLTLEAMRQRDTTAQADIAQAAGLGQQRLASYLQSRGQQFQEYSTGRQLEQSDQQILISLRGMAVQERSQLLNEVNSAAERARAAGDQTGTYTDPQTGQSYETLQAKRDKLTRLIALAEQTGYVPLDAARESGVPEGEVGGFKLGDFLTAEEITALGGDTTASGTAGTTPGAASLSPAQQSYVDTVATDYDMTPDERSQVASLFTSGSTTALQDIQAIVMNAYNRKLAALQTSTPAPAPGSPPGSPPAPDSPPPSVPPPTSGPVATPPTPGSVDGEMARILSGYPSLVGPEAEALKFELRGMLERGQVDMVRSMEASLSARADEAMGRARAALGRGEGVSQSDWTPLKTDQQKELLRTPGFRRQGGSQTVGFVPSPTESEFYGLSPSPTPTPTATAPQPIATIGRKGDVADLLGLGGNEPWQDETQMRSKISSLLKQRFDMDTSPGSDLVTRLYRGEIVTI